MADGARRQRSGIAVNCRVCGNSFFVGRAVFHCYCGAFAHAGCWEKHIIEAHKPPFVLGTVDLDGNFVAKEASAAQKEVSVDKEMASVG